MSHMHSSLSCYIHVLYMCLYMFSGSGFSVQGLVMVNPHASADAEDLGDSSTPTHGDGGRGHTGTRKRTANREGCGTAKHKVVQF